MGGITSWDLPGTEYTPDCQGAKITEVAWSQPERREMFANVRTVEVSRCLASAVPRWGASFGGQRIDLAISYTSPTGEIAIAT
jgi:hypothetical protein